MSLSCRSREVKTPTLQRMIQLPLLQRQSRCAKREFLPAFGGYKTPYRTFDRSDKRLHKTLFIHEFECNVLDGFLFLIIYSEKHGLEIDVGRSMVVA